MNKTLLEGKNINYVIVGKFDYLIDNLVLQWNIAKIIPGEQFKAEIKAVKRYPGVIDLGEYLHSQPETLSAITQELLVYAESNFPDLAQTNVVFCSCFYVSNNDYKDQIELDRLHDSLPVALATFLTERFQQKRRVIKIFGPRDEQQVDRDCEEDRRMKQFATKAFMPDVIITGMIYGDTNKNKIIINMNVRKTRGVNSRPYSHEETDRTDEYPRLTEKLASHIDKNWEDIVLTISSH
jgi:hypothetical protein